MHAVHLDFKHGLVSVDSMPIVVDEKGILAESIERLCSPPIQKNNRRIQFRLLKKSSICGKSADGVIEVGEGKVCTVTFLFDFIEFFESSILESKIIKACEKSSNINFFSNHPSSAFLKSCEWGRVEFFYDAKQGDLSLQITFLHN